MPANAGRRPPQHTHTKHAWLALAFLALLALAFFWPVTLNLGWIPRGGGDLVSFLWPTYSYAAQALGAGRLPLWNHSLYSGAPLVADNQSGLFYPPNLLVFLLWPNLPYRALEWLVIFHVWLAGAGMYFLVRLLLAAPATASAAPPAQPNALPSRRAASPAGPTPAHSGARPSPVATPAGTSPATAAIERTSPTAQIDPAPEPPALPVRSAAAMASQRPTAPSLSSTHSASLRRHRLTSFRQSLPSRPTNLRTSPTVQSALVRPPFGPASTPAPTNPPLLSLRRRRLTLLPHSTPWRRTRRRLIARSTTQRFQSSRRLAPPPPRRLLPLLRPHPWRQRSPAPPQSVFARTAPLSASQPNPVAFPAAILSAIAFMFSDVFVTHVGNLNIIAVAAWLPWSFAALHQAFQRRSLAWAAIAGAILGLAALAGHAQMTLMLALALGLYALYRLALRQPPPPPQPTSTHPATTNTHHASRITSHSSRNVTIPEAQRSGTQHATLPSPGRSGLARNLLIPLLFLLFAFGLSAVSLLPALELTGYTGRARLDYPAAAEYSLPWAGLAGLVSPLVFGRGAVDFWAPWPRVEAGYAGVATLLLATLALWRRPRGTWLFLGLLALLGLLIALGENTPVHRLLYSLVPGFAQLRVPARFVLLTDFALAALAGLGLYALAAAPRPRLVAGAALVLALAGAALLLLAVWRVPGAAAHRAGLLGGLAAFGGLLALSAALLAWRPPGWPAWVVVLLALDLLLHGAWVEVERNDPTLGFARTEAVWFLRIQPGPVRIDNAASAWSPDAAARHGLEDIGGISNPLGLAAYDTYLGAVGSRGTPLYNFLNAQFVVADKGQPPGDASFVPVFAEDPAVDVYLNTNARPRARLVYSAALVPNGEAAFGAIHAPGFDPEAAVVLEARPDQPAPPLELAAAGQGASNVYYLSYAPESFSLVAVTPGPAYLVLSEVWYPGWQATVDGVPAPVYRANFAFRAVYLPEAGEHHVSLRFAPMPFYSGAALTGLTLVTLALWAAVAALRRRRARAASPAAAWLPSH